MLNITFHFSTKQKKITTILLLVVVFVEIADEKTCDDIKAQTPFLICNEQNYDNENKGNCFVI